MTARPDARDDVLAALQLAITDETEPVYVRVDALRQLAEIDRAHAFDVARLVHDPRLSFVTAPLLTLPEPGALARYAHEVGLIADLSSSALEAATLTDVLEPHTHTFDRETDVYPNRYDLLLTSLARLVSPVLDDVLFEEVPHRELDLEPDGAEGASEQLADAYRLRALLPDRTYEIVAGDTSDWLSVEPVLGLLNSLCEARNSALRFVELPTGSQQAAVLAAPASAIRRARADGLLVLVLPTDAET